jgi:PH (Pleckstrin Homology) domain-containing protein
VIAVSAHRAHFFDAFRRETAIMGLVRGSFADGSTACHPGRMELRPPGMSHPAEPRSDAPHALPGGRSPDAGGLQWRVMRKFVVLKIAAAVVFAVIGVVSLGNPVQLSVATVAALLLAGLALRDLLAPVRVAADAGGVTVVVGFAGHRRLPWSQIERVRVDGRTRLGLRSRLLEIDAGDNLYFFSSSELGAPVDEVVQHLVALRAGVRP